MINSEKDLLFFLNEYKKKKIFVISGTNSFFKTKANRLFEKFKNKFIYIKKNKIPIFDELRDISKNLCSYNPEIIVAIGGGSVLDYSKIARVASNPLELKKIVINQNKDLKKKYKLIAIPTTAGSGAEVTPSAVIYYKGKKLSVEGDAIKPDNFFLIPKYLRLLNKKIKASSAFDAISQSIESIFSIRSNNLSLNFAKQSLEISLKNYLKFIKNQNYYNSKSMLLAANLSGKAISITKTTAPHALSYPFTYLYNIDHGHAVSLTLNNILKFNYENLNKSPENFDLNSKYKILFNLTKTKSLNELINYINYLKRQSNLHNNLKKFNINIKNDYTNILSGVNIRRLKNNPIKLSKENLKNIILDI